MKKIISILLMCVVIISSFGGISTYASKQITVTLNGTYINFDVQPTEINGRVLVPVRAIFEALGAKVDWNESKNEVIATKGDVTIRLCKDNTTMYRNNNAITLDVPAKDINDRILVPVRAISEAFGCSVAWNEPFSRVIISSEKSTSFQKCKRYIIQNGDYDNNDKIYRVLLLDDDERWNLQLFYYQESDTIVIQNGFLESSSKNPYADFEILQIFDVDEPYYTNFVRINPEITIIHRGIDNPKDIIYQYSPKILDFQILKDGEEFISPNNLTNEQNKLIDSEKRDLWLDMQSFLDRLTGLLREHNTGLTINDFGFTNYESGPLG